jgi:hypothetical protein
MFHFTALTADPPSPAEGLDLSAVPAIAEIVVKRRDGRLFTTGRDLRGRYARPYRQLRLRVTQRGHWYRSDDPRDDFHNDTLCRGCGHHGHFDYILDYRPCTAPATVQDVTGALLRGTAVAA